MRWRQGRRSSNVEDRRGARPVALGGGALLVVALVVFLLGGDPSDILRLLEGGGGGAQVPVGEPAGPGATGYDEQEDFVRAILADTEDTWNALLGDAGYREPTLVLFADGVSSACGLSSAAVGPFYCPADARVYLDLAFFEELDRRFEAPGDFARAYVIAHEIGHHVQNLAGVMDRVGRAAGAGGEAVRVELQADCLAGVWAHHAGALLEPGDLEEGLAAAAAIGDDRLQRMGGGAVRPESWTHGSSEQRVRWFRRGLEAGRPEACDTFGSEGL